MKLPRRTPWANLAELDQLCSWIYADESNVKSREAALNRLIAWRAITPLPNALEATLSLLAAQQLDCAQTNPYMDNASNQRQTAFALNLRQVYANAIIRLVNGLVDPLQLGTYARSIAAIAAQIGLPNWLVELRHAATHEDLPSLEPLRTAANEALDWLLHNYFLPILSDTSDSYRPSDTSRLRDITPLLKRYKTVSKSITRDASLQKELADEFSKSIRDIEGWIGEARVTFSAHNLNTIGSSMANHDGEDNGDEGERWALNCLSEALLERGSLVPVSIRKRLVSLSSKSSPVLPEALAAIWEPLLGAIQAKHPLFISSLASSAVSILCSRSKDPEKSPSKDEITYDLCVAAWITFAIQKIHTSPDVSSKSSAVSSRKEALLEELFVSMGSHSSGENGDSIGRGVRVLLSFVELDDDLLKAKVRTLTAISRSHFSLSPAWADGDLAAMGDRLQSLQMLARPKDMEGSDGHLSERLLGSTGTEILPGGWRRVDPNQWRQCHIGVLVSV